MDGKYQGLHVLVVGAGSVGTRHIQNLTRLGVGKLTVVEPDNLRRRQIHNAAWHSNILSSLEDALNVGGMHAAMVCTPTYLHAELAAPILDGLHVPVFIEKPVAHTLEDAEYIALAAAGTWVMVGYSLRRHPPLIAMKELLGNPEAGYGWPLYLRAEVGQWLPDWHPGMDYRMWYMAKEGQGGGAVTDLSHEIDYACWLLNQWPTSVQAYVGRVSRLEIDTDDLAELILKFPSGAVASIHMDLIQRVHRRRCLVACENGSIEWTKPDTVSSFLVGLQGWRDTIMDAGRNIQFEQEAVAFLDGVLTDKVPGPTLEEATKVLKVVLAAKESAKTGKEVEIK